MSTASFPRRLAACAGAAALAAALAGCYVVPVHSGPPPAVVPAGPPAPLAFTARLYPANELAGAYGVVTAHVTNDLNGRGHFTAVIGGEAFSGEATRAAAASRDGLANGTGNRGSFLSCQYRMSSATLGTGTCRLSNGATFSMHIGH